MKALVFERNVARFLAARAVSRLGSGRAAGIGPLRLADVEPPELPGEGWVHVRPLLSGICGSDLATIDGQSSRYFEELVSFPFVPGHEVVGTLEGPARSAMGSSLEAGTRVVLEPVLACAARGIDPPCSACAQGNTGACERVAFGHLRPGLQTGYCADVGGGWSTAGIAAHSSQLHAVPDHLSDNDAVTVEPLACAIHAVMSAGLREDDLVGIVGAGTLGLATVAAISTLSADGYIPAPRATLVGGRYAHQRHFAEELGATAVFPEDQLARAIRRHCGSKVIGGPSLRGSVGSRLSSGADIVFDCVGSAGSIEASLAMTRPRGRLVLVGMPGRVHLDLAPLWHREIALVGSYAYGIEPGGRHAFDLAFEVAARCRAGRLVSATYPIDRFEEAIAHAGAAGRRGAIKITFDLRGAPNRQGGRQ